MPEVTRPTRRVRQFRKPNRTCQGQAGLEKSSRPRRVNSAGGAPESHAVSVTPGPCAGGHARTSATGTGTPTMRHAETAGASAVCERRAASGPPRARDAPAPVPAIQRHATTKVFVIRCRCGTASRQRRARVHSMAALSSFGPHLSASPYDPSVVRVGRPANRLLRRAPGPPQAAARLLPISRVDPRSPVDTLAKSRRWTAVELAELRRLSTHAPVEEIATALRRTVSAIRTKAAQKRIALHGDGPRQGPSRLRLPWEQDRGRP